MVPLTVVMWSITFSRALAEFCGEEFDVVSGCNFTYGHVINTLDTVRSITECAYWCSTDYRCLTVKYDEASKVCDLNSERYLSLTTDCQLKFKYAGLSTSSCRTFVNNACIVSNECTVKNSQCVSNKCQCKPGYSYNSVNESCVTACDIYGSTFTAHLNHGHHGNDIRVLDNVETDDVCKLACTEETNLLCRSFDFDPNLKMCYLSDLTAFTDPGNYMIKENVIYYDRNCK